MPWICKVVPADVLSISNSLFTIACGVVNRIVVVLSDVQLGPDHAYEIVISVSA